MSTCRQKEISPTDVVPRFTSWTSMHGPMWLHGLQRYENALRAKNVSWSKSTLTPGTSTKDPTTRKTDRELECFRADIARGHADGTLARRRGKNSKVLG